jgi:hypothetical protein
MSLEPSKYGSREDKNNEETPEIIKMRIDDLDQILKDQILKGIGTPATAFDAAKIASSNLEGVFALSFGFTNWVQYSMVSNPTMQNSVRYITPNNTEILVSAQNTDQDGRLAGMEIRQMNNEAEIDKRFARLEEIVSSIAQKVDSIAGKVEQITQKETVSMPLDIEKEIDNILKEKNYLKINELLNQNKEKVVDILCKKTHQGKIDLNTSEGRDIWRNVIKFHKDQNQNIDPIYSKLAECSRNERQKRLHNFIYNALFAINGGMNASFEAGYWAADKYAKYSLEKKKRKLQEMLAGQ